MFRRAEALGYTYKGHLRGRTSPRRRASSRRARDFSRRAGSAPEFAISIISSHVGEIPLVPVIILRTAQLVGLILVVSLPKPTKELMKNSCYNSS
jgi:hypothetical protein